MNTDQLIARLVAIADERPFAPIGHVVEHELPGLRAQAEAMPEQEWRCFHCDEVFTDSVTAALHFGTHESQSPACTVDADELRKLEWQLARYREEDTDLHRQLAALELAQQQALQRAEEDGYARGLKDAMPEQEPVAWMFQHEETGRTTFEYAPDDADAFEKNNPRWFRVCAVYRSPPDLAAKVEELEGLLSRAQPSHSHSIKCRDSNSDENCLRCAIDAALAKGE